MNEKNPLKPLTSGFPACLRLAGKIEDFSANDHSPKETAALAGEVSAFYKNILARRFKAEKGVAALFESYVGEEDPGVQTLGESHSTLRGLAKEKDMDALYHFGHKLKAYVYFEMNDLFPRIERRLDEKDKAKLAVKLARFGALKPEAA